VPEWLASGIATTTATVFAVCGAAPSGSSAPVPLAVAAVRALGSHLLFANEELVTVIVTGTFRRVERAACPSPVLPPHA